MHEEKNINVGKKPTELIEADKTDKFTFWLNSRNLNSGSRRMKN